MSFSDKIIIKKKNVKEPSGYEKVGWESSDSFVTNIGFFPVLMYFQFFFIAIIFMNNVDL